MANLSSQPLRALALLAAAGVCAFLVNANAGPARKLAWTGRVPQAVALPAPAPAVEAPPPAIEAAPAPPPKAGPRFPADPGAVMREITSRDAWDAYALHIPFLDARRSADFADGHVKGAWSVPVWEAEADTRITEFEARANPGMKQPLVIYCSGGDCEDSRLLANKLVALGYRNLLLYPGGYPDWMAQSRPVEKGARP